MLTKEEIQAGIGQHYGTEGYTRHTCGLLLTDGVVWLAASAEAFWLLDIVSSILNTATIKKESFVHITLDVDLKKHSAIFAANDGGKNGRKPKELYRQSIEYTDFPVEKVEMYLCDKVLMLIGEY